MDAQPAARRIAVWDHNAEYAGPSSCDPIKGARVFHSMRDLLQYTLQRPCPSRIVLQAGRDEFPLFCRWALRAADPRVGHVIVLDEVNLYCSPHKASPELLEVMRIGRHSRVDVVFAARRFQEVHRDLTAQADQLRCFRTTEPRDLKVIADYCGADFAEALRLLPERGSSTWDGT